MHLFCLVNRHAKTQVDWDGFRYTSVCGRCGKPIVRARHSVWKEVRRPARKPS